MDDLGNYDYADSSDDEAEREEEDEEAGRREASYALDDIEESTVIPPGPPQSTRRNPGRGAKSPLLERPNRLGDSTLGLSRGGKRQVAMTDTGYTRDSSPGSSPTPQNRLGSPLPFPGWLGKRKYGEAAALLPTRPPELTTDTVSEPRQGTSTSTQPPVPANPPRARSLIDSGVDVRLGQSSNQDPPDMQSSARGNLDVQAPVRRSNRHQRSVAGQSTGSGGATNSSTRINAGLGARSSSSRAQLGGGSSRVPAEDHGDGSGEYLPKKRMKQQ
ncbi:hypothetical protein VNI00_010552 [Paramarasmius palmivorus]|uniref:Uncharacterized protein n=1 Tax=Paramarasmius palmivorus TaxID=297713 RepID=A0AAW0CK35_9AGAR